jgi:UDP-N-acetylmuramoyl-L-alanyl-D-glutamate--2,6-diaminopimelate ligase
MRLSHLLPRLEPLAVDGDPDVAIDAVTRDSRAARPGAVFVAIRGAKVDGHDLVRDVSCRVVVAERPVPVPVGTTRVLVRDSKAALAALAAGLAGDPGAALQVVGVTGTNGKTTTTTLVENALRRAGIKVGRIGTTGNAIDGVPRKTGFTTPEAPELQALLGEMRDAGCTAVAMEVSSIGLAQRRVDGIPFAVGVFTNLTQDHLDFHGTMAAYAEAKARLFRELLRPAGGMPRALLCADDPAWRAMGPPSDRWTYGFSADTDLCALSARVTMAGTVLSLRTPLGPTELTSALVGRYNAQNLLAALGSLLLLGLPLDRAVAALSAAEGAPGRLERVPGRGPLVIVDYAHSDDALANALPVVRELIPGGRLWVVFGCGGDRDRTKRPKMGRVAAALADEVIVTSDNPRHEDAAAIAAEILTGIDRPVAVELDRSAAIHRAIAAADPADAVVIAGKGHETTQQIGDVFHPFDDRVVAAAALARR